MPRGVYLRTEEINKAHSGNHPSEITRKKMRLSKLGIKCSLEQRISMKKPKKSCNNPTQFIGHTPWNKKSPINVKRKIVCINGKWILNSHYIYMKYNNISEIPKGFLIHHIDGDPTNDDPLNLRMMTKADHTFFHGRIDKERVEFKNKIKRLRDKFKSNITVISKRDFLNALDEIMGVFD